MLKTVSDYIANETFSDFATYYQHFVVESQNQIIDQSINKAQSELSTNSGAANDIIRQMNILAEELKHS